MYNRIFDIDRRLDEGMFLFGARQVGKSTLLKEKFNDAVYFDLICLIRICESAFNANRNYSKRPLTNTPKRHL